MSLPLLPPIDLLPPRSFPTEMLLRLTIGTLTFERSEVPPLPRLELQRDGIEGSCERVWKVLLCGCCDDEEDENGNEDEDEDEDEDIGSSGFCDNGN